MAYTKNMQAASMRHYSDGTKLLADKRFDNAGYHFGLAAECAIKKKLLESGVLEGDDAIWKHWPSLKGLALIAISGRQASPVRALMNQASFMQGWDIVMRYSENASVIEAQASKWQQDANSALGLLI